MHKEYKINFITSSYAIIAILLIPASMLGVYMIYMMRKTHAPLILLSLVYATTLVFFFFFTLCLLYFNKLKISVDDEILTFKMPDKVITFNIKNIYKIEKELSYAGIGYYIFYYDDKYKKRHIKFNNDLGGHKELIDYLQRKSGIKMRWEGTFDIEKEKRPVIRVLKIIFNIIITILIVFIFVVYPFLASNNRYKERRQGLPARSLWP